MQLTGEGPWTLSDGGGDVSILSLPGHTSGSLALYYTPDKALFTGDHLAFEQSGNLTMMRQYNKQSVAVQLSSIAGLKSLDFHVLLPGHDRRGTFASAKDRHAKIDALLHVESL